MKTLTTLWVLGMFLATPALADDVEDVKAAVRDYFAAISAEDTSGIIQYQMLGKSIFPAVSSLRNLVLLKNKKKTSNPPSMLVRGSTYRSGT